MNNHEKLNYVEFPAKDLLATKRFFTATFDWRFKDYGSDYSYFTNQGLNGGFYKSDTSSQTETGGALLVFYSTEIEATMHKIVQNGGKIIRPIFEFPGGCRFHFQEPSGNEFAVWSETHKY